MSVWLAALALMLGARPGFVPVVGRAEGLSVVVVRSGGGPEERHGDLLPMTARRTTQPGELELRHTAALAPITRSGFDHVSTWLRGPGAAYLPDLTAALGRSGVVVMPDTEPAPMDGSSAGVAMTVAAASALLDLPVLQNVAFTGAVTADGTVTNVGGVPDKLRGALRGRLDTLVAPRANAEQALATLAIEDLGRIRIVGVSQLREALPEGFGPAGPWGQSWQQAQDELAHGIAHLAEDHVADAGAALAAYRALAPLDLTAALWQNAALAAAQGTGANSHIAAPVRAAALRFACRYDDAIALCREPQVNLAVGAALSAIAEQCRRDRAADQRDLLLAESHAALDAGDLAKARARLDAAAKTLALEPGGADAVAWQTAEVRLAESRLAVRDRPGDLAAWRELAAQAQTRRQWREAAEAWRKVGELAEAERKAAYRQALCWYRLGECDQARLVLLGNLLNWPTDNAGRELLAAMGTDVDGPRPVLALPSRLAGTVMLQGGCDESGVTTWLSLDERDLTRGQGRLAASWDTSRSADGPHLLTAVSCDGNGNWGLGSRVAVVANGAGRVPTYIECAPRAAPPLAVHVLLAGELRLRRGDSLVVHADRLAGALLQRAQRPAGDLHVALLPGDQRAVPATQPLVLQPADGAREVGLYGQFANGTSLTPIGLRLRWTEELPGQLVAHAAATGRTKLEVRPPSGFRPVLATLIADGQPGGWQLPTDLTAPAGAKQVSALLVDAGQVMCQTSTLDLTP